MDCRVTIQFPAKAMAIALASTASLSIAQTPSGVALAAQLDRGGYVIVMRHAHAPEQPPSAAEADRANSKRERQLDAAGRAAAEAMGKAVRALHLPIGVVWSSPTYRARETVRLLGFPAPRIAAELGDNGRSMQAANGEQAAWLRARANERPRPGTDTVIVTQYPNISGAFGDAAAGMKDGEALVFRPASTSAPQPVGRIAIEQWPALATQTERRPQAPGN